MSTRKITVVKNYRGTFDVMRSGTTLPLMANLPTRTDANAWADFYRSA